MVPVGIGKPQTFGLGIDDAVAVQVDVLRPRSDAVDLRKIKEDDRGFARNAHARIGADAALAEIRVVFRHAAELANIVFAQSRPFVGLAGTRQPFVGLTVHVDVVEKDLTHVVGHDVDDELHAAFVELIRKTAQRRQIAKVRIVLEKILRPIPVVGRKTGVFLDVFDDRRNPQRRHAEFLEVIEFVDDALPVAPVITAHRTRVDVEIVVDIPVMEPVDDELIDDFVAPVLDVCLKGNAHLIGLCRQGIGVNAPKK